MTITNERRNITLAGFAFAATFSAPVWADAYLELNAPSPDKYSIYEHFAYAINVQNYQDNELGFVRRPPVQHYENRGYARLEYEIEGSPRVVGVHLHYAGIRNEDLWIDGDRIARGLAVLPEFVLELIPRDFAITTGHTGGPHFRACTRNDHYRHIGCGNDPEGLNVIATPYTFDYMFPFRYEDRNSPVLRGEWEEQVLHEFAHLLQHNPELSRQIWDADAWDAAIASDGEDSQITEYATTSAWEDFAETFVVWLITRDLMREARSDELTQICNDIETRIPGRLTYFDTWFDRLHKSPDD